MITLSLYLLAFSLVLQKGRSRSPPAGRGPWGFADARPDIPRPMWHRQGFKITASGVPLNLGAKPLLLALSNAIFDLAISVEQLVLFLRCCLGDGSYLVFATVTRWKRHFKYIVTYITVVDSAIRCVFRIKFKMLKPK